MNIIPSPIEGVMIIEDFKASDDRGSFTKIFNEQEFEKNGLKFEVKEAYYSCSNKNVIRGMHFQLPPHDHAKIVHVMNGEALDVLLDLRKNSATFGKTYSFELRSEEHMALYIPKGIAHGFKSLTDNMVMIYLVSSGYDRESDSGIFYDSFGFDWNVEKPIVSGRDIALTEFGDFKSPF